MNENDRGRRRRGNGERGGRGGRGANPGRGGRGANPGRGGRGRNDRGDWGRNAHARHDRPTPVNEPTEPMKPIGVRTLNERLVELDGTELGRFCLSNRGFQILLQVKCISNYYLIFNLVAIF